MHSVYVTRFIMVLIHPTGLTNNSIVSQQDLRLHSTLNHNNYHSNNHHPTPNPNNHQLLPTQPPKNTAQKSNYKFSLPPLQYPHTPNSKKQDINHRIIDPYQKMYKWAQNNETLKDALNLKRPLTKQQKSILVNYMVNDQYFVQQLSEQLQMDQDSKWVKQLGPRALKRYVKIVGGLDEQILKDEIKLKQVEKKLVDDYEIGPVYEQYAKNQKQRLLQSSYNLIVSNFL